MQGGPASGRSHRLAAFVAGALALAAGARAGNEPGVSVRGGDGITATLDEGDEDAFAIDLSEGGSLSVTFKYPKGSLLVPSLRLVAPDGSEPALGAALKNPGTTKASISKFLPGPGTTGTWQVIVGSQNDAVGDYTATFKTTAPKAVKSVGLTVPAGGTLRLEVTGDDGALLTFSAVLQSGPAPVSARLLDPAGIEVPGAAALVVVGTKGVSAKKVPVAQGFGRYALEITGDGSGPATVDATVSAKFAKVAGRKAVLPAEPVLASVGPALLRQEETGHDLAVTGSNFPASATARITGDGVTVDGVEIAGPGSATVTVSAAADAAFGSRDLVFCPPSLTGEPQVFPGAVVVHAPVPTVTAASPSPLLQGQGPTTVTVTGTGFRTGGAITISGSGLTLGSTTVLSATSATVPVTASSSAAVGLRDVTFTQPAAGGGASGTGTGVLRVNYPDPVLTSIAPTLVKQGDGVLLTLTGNHFRTGGSVSCGSGVGVSAPTRISDTSFQATLAVDAAATFGARDVVYAQPADGGAASVTLSGALAVNAPDPSVTSASPASLAQGTGPTTVTLTGTGFRSGGAITLSGSGLALGATSVTSATQASVPVTVDIGATFGARDATFTQPAGGGGAAGSGTGALSILAPTPTVTSIDVTSLVQGSTGTTITLTGTNFRSGGSVSFGTGISVTGTAFVSTTSFQATVDAHLTNATLGLHDCVYTQPAAGGGASATLSNALQVNAPAPTITGVGPAILKQEQNSVTVTVDGTNFRAGGALSLSGTGLTVGSTTIVSATQATVSVSVGAAATTGARNVTYTQPAAGGSGAVTSNGAITVNCPDPTVTSISPASIMQGATGTTITLTGTGFRSGGGASFGTGLTVTGSNLVSATSFEATVDVHLTSATLGAHDVVFTQPAGGGGATGTLSGGLQVNAPAPTVTSIDVASLVQGSTGTTITLTGTNFRSGGSVSFGTGITTTGTNFVSTTSFQATVDAHVANATLGLHDCVYTQPAAGGGASATLSNALQVNAPTPTITSVSPTTTTSTSFTLTVNGTSFRSGGAVTLSGSGTTLGATTFVSTAQVTVPVTVLATAAAGARNVTYTQPVAGGSGAVTSNGALTIHYPNPTLASVTPSTAVQGDTGKSLALAGTGFRSDGTATISGTGITITNQAWNSDTSITLTVDVAGGATTSARDVTYTQHASGGGASATLSGGLTITGPGPTMSSITPSQWRPGDARQNATLVGTGYNTGTAVTLSGSGITVHSTTVDSATQLTVNYSVAGNASVGQRNVTITPGSGGSGPSTFNNAVTVVPADPTVLSCSHASIQAGTSAAVTVRGTNFRSGDAVSVSGANVTVSSVSVVDTTTITATISPSSGAATGARDLTVAHAASEGGRSGTLAGAFAIVSTSSPTVTGVSPSTLGRTGSGGPTRVFTVTVTGTNFATGAVLSASRTSSSGLTVVSNSSSVVNGTTLTAQVSVLATCTVGAWDLIVTNPNSGAGTGSGLLSIVSESTLAVNAVVASSGSSRGGERVTIYGSGFSSGAVVDFGTVRAVGTQAIDGSTIVTTVPLPAAVSTSSTTTVGISVTNTSGSPVTLANAYTYARDTDATQPKVQGVLPSATSGNPANLRIFVFVLDEEGLPTSVGSTTNYDWFGNPSNDIASARVTNVGLAVGRRLIAVQRNASPASLSSAKTYFVNLPNSAQDLAGNALDPFPFGGSIYQASFTVGAATDVTAPTVSTITPSDTSSGVALDTRVTVVFSEVVDPLTVSAANITFKQGSTTLGASYALGTDGKTLLITPETALSASTTYTTAVTTGLKDLCANAHAGASFTFTTAGSDGTAPTIDAATIEHIPSSMDGSGTYVDRNAASQNFDLYLPRGGWLVEVAYSDAGGSGCDEATFSAKANVAVGGNSANAELASNFTVTPTGASWRIPATGFATGDGATFTFLVKDKQGNTSSSRVLTFNVADLASTATGDAASAGTSGGDLDPFASRQAWVLRSDLDAYTAVYSTPSGQQGATTTVASNGVLDIDESLRVVGLNTGSMTASAASCVNGLSVGTNAILRRLFLERTRALLRAHYGIAEDGTYGTDSANVEFLLQGEQGSLASLPAYGASNSSSTGAAFSEMSLGGTLGAEAGATTASGTLAQAYLDGRNNRQEDNLNFGGGSITGVYLLGMMKLQVNSSSGTTFRTRISNKLVTVYGGTPAGEGSLDATVLSGSFVRASGSGAEQARYDDLMDAVELVAAYTASVTAHEIGHSTGLVQNKIVSSVAQDGAPKTGLFGNAHYNNTFTEATAGAPNTSFHLNFPGNDTMSASTSFDAAVGTGTNFQRFSPLDLAYLLRRLVYDEGK